MAPIWDVTFTISQREFAQVYHTSVHAETKKAAIAFAKGILSSTDIIISVTLHDTDCD